MYHVGFVHRWQLSFPSVASTSVGSLGSCAGEVSGRQWLPRVFGRESLTWIVADHHTRIWTDCANVVNRVQLLLDDPSIGRPNAHDADLWEQIAVELLRDHAITVHKVAAHVGSQVQGPVEEWAAYNNNIVDQLAKSFNVQRPSEFWSSWNRLLVQVEAHPDTHIPAVQCVQLPPGIATPVDAIHMFGSEEGRRLWAWLKEGL